MNNFVTDAINLKSYNLKENDKIVLMYSKEKGLIKGVAKGCKKPKSKLGARMDNLVANKLMLYEGKNLDTICEAQAVNTFSKSRQNIDKLLFSTYVSEIVRNFGVEEDPCSKEVYDIFYKSLEKIANSVDKKEILISVIKFQLKMMLIAGFGIEFDSCLSCGRRILDENMYFSITQGGVICEECATTAGVNVKLHYKIRDFLQAMLQFDFNFKNDYEEKATEHVCEVCYKLLDEYVEHHSPKAFKTTKLLNEVAV